MGFCYQVSGGRRSLCCDSCGNAGGVRKHLCPAGWCQSWALCSSCWAKRSELGWLEAHESCASSSAEYAAVEARKAALLAGGAYVRTAAVGKDPDPRRHFAPEFDSGVVFVWFRNAAGEERTVEMGADRYRAVPLLEPATYATFFPAVREAVAS